MDQHGPDYWTFPNWRLDITEKRTILQQAGIRMFAHMDEPVPPAVTLKKPPRALELEDWAAMNQRTEDRRPRTEFQGLKDGFRILASLFRR